MAAQFLVSPILCSPIPFSSKLFATLHRPWSNIVAVSRNNAVYATSQTIDPVLEPVVVRRTANYQPNYWDYDTLMSLTSVYKADIYKEKADELKEKVRELLHDTMGSVESLDLVDAIQRLGLSHYYNEEIKNALDHHASIDHDEWLGDDLYTTSLRFRLLRLHGYDVAQDVFDKFKDEKGALKMCLTEDVKGMLSMYEASFLGLEEEDFIDEVKAFTTKHLKELKGNTNSSVLAKKVSHSLELPLHWRTSRLESRWYIDTYESEDNMVQVLLDLAKLDYNIVQATHQSEVGRLTRWWKDLGLHEMDFFRDRILEHYFWSLGMVPEEQFGRFRVGLAQVTTLITVIDDIYDVYGSLDELVLFTAAVERWEVSAMEQLPPYMKVCYMALLNTNNEIGYEILREQGFDITPHQKKVWVDLCKAYFVEAKWFYEGYTPTLKEYLDNAVMSIAAPLMLENCYFLTTEKITKEALDCIESMPSLIYNSAMLLRLADDLGTSSDEIARGDVPKSIQCYMHEAGVSEEVAREHVKYLINEAWKKMNKARTRQYPFFEPFISAAPNLGRQAQCMYQFGDGHGIPDQETKDRLNSLLVEPIPLKKL
ncbi:Myrcene synthase protein [Thalictrum thalictroides]|uniref:Myrcene synthase protein n=1 Tax=Thalictrum thalictroides TaxID=46969 RepID=A0A7J6VK27_THATH|nr:Myrcene synthase protein [Thalictrum thalictroides]